jgi:hypothetical protein
METHYRNRLIFGVMLLAVITLADIILHELHLPSWPMFMILMFFFLAHIDKNVAPNIIIGALLGIACFDIARPIILPLVPFTGLFTARLMYLLGTVGSIILFREFVPIAFNDYAFAFLLLSGMASRERSDTASNPLAWMIVTLVGGTLIILAILGIRQIIVVIETRSVRKVAALRSPASSGVSPKFSYTGPPAFSADIPDDFQKGTPKTIEGQILTGKTASGVNVTISVYNIPKDISMEDSGPKSFRPRLAKSRGLKTEDIKIISNEKFELDDGIIAWKCAMKWSAEGSTMVTTYLITADKDGKRVTIVTHPWADPAEVLRIIQSLSFK